jgi:hypothetical protein
VNLTRFPKEDHLPTEQVEATELERVIVYTSGGEIFRTSPDRPWGPLSLLYNGYRVFPGSEVRPGRAADHSPPSSAEVLEE